MCTLRIFLSALFCFSVASAQAQDDIPFDISITESCLVGKRNYDRHMCIGISANQCMETQLGGTTVGMRFCLSQELFWWDEDLNQTYGKLLAREKAEDEDNKSNGINPPLLKADALREMQRAWIKYRDALCEHEAVQWGGGTGAGPALLSCLLGETGRQVFVLKDRLVWEARYVSKFQGYFPGILDFACRYSFLWERSIYHQSGACFKLPCDNW